MYITINAPCPIKEKYPQSLTIKDACIQGQPTFRLWHKYANVVEGFILKKFFELL